MLRIVLALWLALAPAFAWAGSMSLLGVGKAPAAGAAPVPTYQTNLTLVDNGATKNASAVGIGSASSNRQVFMAIMAYATVVPTSVTFTPSGGGVITATQVTPNPPGAGTGCFIYQATVPTATAMDVAVNFSSNPFANYQAVFWTIDGNTMSSTTPVSDNSNGVASGASSVSTTISTSAGGFTLACGFMNTNASSGSIGGTDTYNQRMSMTVPSGWGLAADASGLSTNASDTVTATFGTNTAILGVAAVTYR